METTETCVRFAWEHPPTFCNLATTSYCTKVYDILQDVEGKCRVSVSHVLPSSQPFLPGCLHGLLPEPFLLSYSVGFLGRLFDRVNLIKPVSNVRRCVRPSVHKKVLRFQWHLAHRYIEIDEWCKKVCSITRSKDKVKVTSPSKLEISGDFSKVIFSTIYNGSW